MNTSWHVYSFKLVDAYTPEAEQSPYYCEAVCVEPGHPRKARGQGTSPELAKADLIVNIKRLLENSEIITV